MVRPVIPRRVFAVLVGGLMILIVAVAMLMAFHTLVSALGDEPAARALLWTAVGCLILALTNLVLLVAALGVQALQDHDEGTEE
jgi:hypothetical protein